MTLQSHQNLETSTLPLVVADYMVLGYKIHSLLTVDAGLHQGRETCLLNSNNFEQYVRRQWAVILNRGPDSVNWYPHTLTIVNDNNDPVDYWRRSVYFPGYKGNRSPKPKTLLKVLEIGLDYVTQPRSPYIILDSPGQEADDIAGSLVRLQKLLQYELPGIHPVAETRKIHLYTVDTDWLQLVGDTVTWYNTAHWEPRVRDSEKGVEWLHRKLKTKAKKSLYTKVYDIVDWKMADGDSSDGLPEGSPRFLIDLLNCPYQHDLTRDHAFRSRLLSVLNTKHCNVRYDHLEKSRKWLLKKGYSLVV